MTNNNPQQGKNMSYILSPQVKTIAQNHDNYLRVLMQMISTEQNKETYTFEYNKVAVITEIINETVVARTENEIAIHK